LIAHVIRVPICGYNDVDMIRTATYCVQFPETNSTMVSNRRLNNLPLRRIQQACVLRHPYRRFELASRIRLLKPLLVQNPSPLITG
jgi:hypothetical protein